MLSSLGTTLGSMDNQDVQLEASGRAKSAGCTVTLISASTRGEFERLPPPMRDLPAKMGLGATARAGTVAEETWVLAVGTTCGPGVTLLPVRPRPARPLSTRQLCVCVLLAPTARALLMATCPMQVLNTCSALADGRDGVVPNLKLPEVIRCANVMPKIGPSFECVAG